MNQSPLIQFGKPVARTVTKLFSFFNRMNGKGDISLADVRSLLCVELTRLGDVVSMLPALAALKQALPDAKLSVAVDARYVPLFRFVPWADEVLGFRNTTRILGLSGAFLRLRSLSIDLICSMSPSYRNAFICSSLRAAARVGYFSMSDSLTPFLFTSRIEGNGVRLFQPKEYDRENIYVRSARICEALGIPFSAEPALLTVGGEDADILQQNLVQKGFSFSQPYLIFHPFARWKYRHWKLESSARLIEELLRQEMSVVLIGDEHEKREGERIRSLLKGNGHLQLAFGLPLDELLVLMKSAALFVGTDSGPLHLATALRVPVIGLYGPANPHFTAPPSSRNIYLFEQVECSPCDQRTCIRPHNPCVHLIRPEDVLARIQQSLKTSR